MIFILTISFLWGLILTVFVLSPLLNIKKPKRLKSPLILIALILGHGVLSFSPQANAEEQVVPQDVAIPPPYIQEENGYWVPSVNQYILMPAQGVLHVYYVGMFSNSFHAKSTKILFPFPKNIENVRLHSKATATLDTTNSNKEVVLNTPLDENTNQLQAEFDLQAPSGSVAWKKNSLHTLPGVTILIMPEYNGILRNMISYFYPNVNVWPARITNFPQDFKSMLSTDVLKPDASSKDQSGELSRQFIRVGDMTANFPEFDVVGIVPVRFFIYLLILAFLFFFAVACLISLHKLKS
ncbi:MAG: hypothetical protein V4591_03800 [Bdellovibrionota bacterium]